MGFGVLRAAIIAALFLCSGARDGLAQDVTLTSRDGLIRLHGTMESYDGEFYRVKTSYGLLTLDGQGVRCDGPGCPSLTAYSADIRIAAPVRVGDFLPALINGFALARGYDVRRGGAGNPAGRYVLHDKTSGQDVARVQVMLAGADQVLADLQAGRADLALSFQLPGALPGSAQVLALDAAVPVVARENPVRRLSLPGLAAALSGQVRNWAELGGMDAPIVLHALAEGAGVQQGLEAQLGIKTAASALRHADAASLVAAVARDPWALGVTSIAAMGNTRALDLTGDCGFLIRATPEAIKAGDYPLRQPLYLYRPDRRASGAQRDLLEWLASPQAQRSLRGMGLIDPLPDRIGLEAQGARLAHAILAAPAGLLPLQQMVTDLAGMDRLTITFRFENESRWLDAPSRDTVATLALALEAGLYDGQVLLFAGFSDGRGDAGANQRLSRQRAEAVRDAVLGNAPLLDARQVTLKVAGFGAALPMACDDTDMGATVNRRVEVWVQPVAVTDNPPSGN